MNYDHRCVLLSGELFYSTDCTEKKPYVCYNGTSDHHSRQLPFFVTCRLTKGKDDTEKSTTAINIPFKTKKPTANAPSSASHPAASSHRPQDIKTTFNPQVPTFVLLHTEPYHTASTEQRTFPLETSGSPQGKAKSLVTPLFIPINMTWWSASRHCRSLGLSLLYFPSPFALSPKFLSTLPRGPLWIGLRRNRLWGNWEWEGRNP
ncbi:uncharacterized protein LOC128667078 isoform X2 [Bombina bombina]|uniref:uncharacterized protein LOC128667078 isoform X2 n=1 Tax=Bombina bombina TaxID=8345 RepID=UPI00235ACCCF|nr:uncharacterized protein LOC128667078 isoform X2 [Bombina bombina]